MTEQTSNTQTQLDTYLLCLQVADPATLLASNNVLGTLFVSENSLFTHWWKTILKYHYLIILIFTLIEFESPKPRSAPLISDTFIQVTFMCDFNFNYDIFALNQLWLFATF